MKKLATFLAVLFCVTVPLMVFSGCSKVKISNENTPFVMMSEEMDGVFNPFFASAGADMEVVGMTQIGMINSDKNGAPAYGENEPTVVLDFEKKFEESKNQTVYRFVLKNDILFSDGKPLTMRDVLFNMYVYLDPVYTGSSTMYSTDIVGLADYRTQQRGAGSDAMSQIEKRAAQWSESRVDVLKDAYQEIVEANKGTTVTIAKMKEYMADHAVDSAEFLPENYKLLDDYNLALELFKKELNDDYKGSMDAYKEEPYRFNDIEAFIYAEGYCDWDKETQTVKKWGLDPKSFTTREQVVETVFNDKITYKFDEVITYYMTASELRTKFIASAKEMLLSGGSGDELNVKSVEGIRSLGDENITSVAMGGKTYKVATQLNSNGSVVNKDEYQVLEISINGVDPKAIWNFSFTVAPMHYYSNSDYINAYSYANKKFGVKFSSLDFMEKVLKGGDKVGVPLGAGPYMATDKNDGATPKSGDFKSDNVVYLKRNDNFLLGKPIIRRIRYQVVNSSRAIDVVKEGTVHYTEPQATNENMNTIEGNKKTMGIISVPQLGYGYIGVNSGKIPNENLRKAIMSAMNTKLSVDYYQAGLADTIAWPMSKESWAYPKTPDGAYDNNNTFDYASFVDDTKAKERILKYMADSGVKAGDKELTITFTIAGSNLSQHPTYPTFKHAMELLNDCGWNIDVRPDNYALSKLSTGALSVWAAAWGSTIDPDMYQVYHKNSSATSTLNWGYRQIKAGEGTANYAYEGPILNDLSELIDAARETDDKSFRTAKYKEAMREVLKLAVELPVYQRNNIFLYNKNVIDETSLPSSGEINAYASPLQRIWEIRLKEGR